MSKMNENEQMRFQFTKSVYEISEEQAVPINTAVEMFCDVYYTLLKSGDKATKVFTNYLLSQIFVDAYKIFSYEMKKGPLEVASNEVFARIYHIENLYELKKLICEDYSLFCDITLNAFRFTEINELGRILINLNLSNKENEYLLNIAPIHEIDLSWAKRELDLDVIINSYREQVAFYKDAFSMKFREGILLNIVGFLREFYYLNRENGEDMIITLVHNDIQTCDDLYSCAVADEAILNRRNLYHNKSYYFVRDEVLKNQDLMMDILDLLCARYVDKMYHDVSLKSLYPNQSRRKK